eukprot:7807209-Alexandrium_andersonii.AAC.1
MLSRTRGSAGRPRTWGMCLAFAWKRIRRVPILANANTSTVWCRPKLRRGDVPGSGIDPRDARG